jgi:hypothetical protein
MLDVTISVLEGMRPIRARMGHCLDAFSLWSRPQPRPDGFQQILDDGIAPDHHLMKFVFME